MSNHEQGAYAVYHDWKDWTQESFGKGSPELHGTYAAIVRSHSTVTTGAAIDFGFGNGEMLHTLRDLGFDATGVERNEFLREIARRKGFNAVDSLADPGLCSAGSVAVISAFHVLEHLDKDTLRSTLSRFAELLQPGGALIAAFPNGDSPFAASAFNGDITHVTWIGSSMAEQVGKLAGLQLTSYHAFPSLSRHSPRVSVRVKGWFRSLAERVLNGALSKIYYGGDDKVLSPIAVAVWTKA